MEETMQQDEKKFRFLIDGFPRNEDNLQGWNTVMDEKADVKFVLFFDCGNEVRHGNLSIHAECWADLLGAILGHDFASHLTCPQVCINRCLERGKSSGRTDDNRESLEKRYSPALKPESLDLRLKQYWFLEHTLLFNKDYQQKCASAFDQNVFLCWFPSCNKVQPYLISIDFCDPFSWLLGTFTCVFDLNHESPVSCDPNNQASLPLMQNPNLPSVYTTNHWAVWETRKGAHCRRLSFCGWGE